MFSLRHPQDQQPQHDAAWAPHPGSLKTLLKLTGETSEKRTATGGKKKMAHEPRRPFSETMSSLYVTVIYNAV